MSLTIAAEVQAHVLCGWDHRVFAVRYICLADESRSLVCGTCEHDGSSIGTRFGFWRGRAVY